MAAALGQSCGLAVTFRRGVFTVADVTAVVGETPFRTDDETGYSVISHSRDYLVAAADLIIDGSVVTPLRGDEIDEVIDGDTITFRVTAPNDEPCWRYSDDDNTRIRIHTIRVNTAPG